MRKKILSVCIMLSLCIGMMIIQGAAYEDVYMRAAYEEDGTWWVELSNGKLTGISFSGGYILVAPDITCIENDGVLSDMIEMGSMGKDNIGISGQIASYIMWPTDTLLRAPVFWMNFANSDQELTTVRTWGTNTTQSMGITGKKKNKPQSAVYTGFQWLSAQEWLDQYGEYTNKDGVKIKDAKSIDINFVYYTQEAAVQVAHVMVTVDLSGVEKEPVSIPIADVTPDTPYAAAIQEAVDNGVFDLDENGDFNPNQTITYKEYIMALYRQLGGRSAYLNKQSASMQTLEEQKAIYWYIETTPNNQITNSTLTHVLAKKSSVLYDLYSIMAMPYGKDEKTKMANIKLWCEDNDIMYSTEPITRAELAYLLSQISKMLGEQENAYLYTVTYATETATAFRDETNMSFSFSKS